MGFFKEFKDFAVRGNLVDIAVAFIMGASFGKVVSSFVDGIIMPLLGMLTGGVDFSDKKWVIQSASEAKTLEDGTVINAVSEVAVSYGQFVTHSFDLVLVSFAVFLVVKARGKISIYLQEN
jgi:large conductance mechanosensitive channel